jgi:hypothetical protein
MVDCVVAEHDLLSELPRFVAEHKIVGAVVGCYAKAADASNRVAPEGHRGTERELHALHRASGQYAGGHFDRHADGLEPGP